MDHILRQTMKLYLLLLNGALTLCLTVIISDAQPQTETFDVLIKNGRVLDGNGNPWFYADIGIRQDRIVAMGYLDDATGSVVLDASGLYVAPGFIDVHSHAATGLGRNELKGAEPILAQGVTTVIVNPDGGGAWPLSEQRLSYENQGVGVNVALMVGHGTVRRQVMGMEDRRPTEQELSQMKLMIRDGLAAGAFGLSSGLYYAPGSYAHIEEIVALAKEVHPRGVYASHVRDEGDYSIGLVAAVEEVIQVAERAKISGIVTHMKALGPNNWGKSVAATVRIERARARGVSVWVDQYPYAASGTSITGALVPRWAQSGETMPGELSPLQRRLENGRELDLIRKAMLANIKRRGGAQTLQVASYIADRSLEGRTLYDIAEEKDVAPVDLALSLLKTGGASLVSFNMSEEDVAHIMRKDYTMTCSDGGLVAIGEGKPHPRYYGTFPRKIDRYVKNLRTVSLPHAVRSMTSLPAAVFGLTDRGQLRTGALADIVVIDLDKIKDRATYKDPHRFSEGVVNVLVNGQLTEKDVLAGRVLRPNR